MGKTARNSKGVDLKQVLDWYDAWVREDTETRVAAALGITFFTLREREKRHSELRYARQRAEERREKSASFSAYVFSRLSTEARKTWQEILFWEGNETSPEKIEYVLSSKPTRLRQELFVHALIHSNYDLSSACRMVNIPVRQLEHWRKSDLEFRQLIEEIQWHKKNFFETALMDLVEARHPGAVIFANRTVNADRGYSEKLQVDHSGTVATVGFSVDDLNLDIETRKSILRAIQEKKMEQKALPETTRPPIDI